MNVKTLLLATTALVIAAPSMAMAAQGDTIEAVVVTARKKSEELLKVPVAISALTSKDIETRGIETVGDVANFTPGINVDSQNSGGARADRSFQTIIIRGMNPSSTQSPTSTVFIDGVPVDPDFIQNVDDVARVEVLKGPQSAFFGRSTFAGAVNVITKDPGNVFGGSVSAEVGTHDTRAFKANISGPIIKDVLTFRVGAYYDGHDGSYNNPLTSGQTLGAQTTKGVNLAVTFKPTSKLTIKASGQFFEDNDGPGATGLILQQNCKIGASAFGPYGYYCGTLPNGINSPAANTTQYVGLISTLLANPAGKIIKPSDAVKGYGLKRDGYHGALNIAYDLPYGLTLTSLTGASYQDWSEVSDLSNLDLTGYPGFPYLVEQTNHQFSQEFRLATDQTQPLRGLLGVSYVESKAQEALGFAGGASPTGPSGAKTSGIFFSVAYDVLPKVTINFDGRYQIDDIAAYQAGNPGATLYTSGVKDDVKFYNFLPRVSLQYKITPDVMTYFTYSEGVNPGTFNSGLQVVSAPVQGLTAAGLAYVQSTYGGAVIVKPENLTNYELGIKGRFWDGKATLSADIYYDKWTNEITNNSALITNPAYDTKVNPPAVPLDLVGPFATNAGKSTYEGFEVDGKFLPIAHVSVNVSGAITGTRYDTFLCGTGAGCYSSTTGPAYIVQTSGKEAPNVSKYSASVGAQYSNTLSYYGGVDWFVRGDFVYKSGMYVAADNLVKTPDIDVFNLRAGLSKGPVALDAYIDNLFENRSPTSVIPNYNFTTFGPAFMTALPQLRTFGMKLKYTF